MKISMVLVLKLFKLIEDRFMKNFFLFMYVCLFLYLTINETNLYSKNDPKQHIEENISTGSNILWLTRFEVWNSSNLSPSETIAEVLRNNKYSKCIDLRTSGSYTSMDLLRHASVDVISSNAIPGRLQEVIKIALCATSNINCSTISLSKGYPIHELILDIQGKDNRDSASRSLPVMLPTFSKACMTGVYRDSWNDTASTDEAKAYLQRLYPERKLIRSLAIKELCGDHVYTLGFIK